MSIMTTAPARWGVDQRHIALSHSRDVCLAGRLGDTDDGVGILPVRKRAARMGRNPATGEAIKIKASKNVAFRPAKELKEAV
jgi:hypothetical protein